MTKKIFCRILLFFVFIPCFSQTVLEGVVKDEQGNYLFATNVYFKSAPDKGTTTDFDGKFRLKIPEVKTDTLVVSFTGFKTSEIPFSDVDVSRFIVIVLREQVNPLQEITIKYTDPVSGQFAMVKMNMIRDVYMNPVAQADPLKAITIFPSSTTIDETANVSLRGSDPDRSRVILNGVPVYKPVSAADLNNQGFFSLFNAEVIDRQYVYASNPPLTFGNTTAGLVVIETKRNISNDQLLLSLGLVNTGFFLSQSTGKKTSSFIQVYGNYMFSGAYVAIQREKLPQIKSFSAKDTGINFHHNIGERTEFNSFNYFNDEQFNGKNMERYTYKGALENKRKRFFSINNLKIYAHNGAWQINNGVSIDRNNFQFGNIKFDTKHSNVFTSVNYKWFVLHNTDIKFGISHDYHSHIFKGSTATYYYALSPESPDYFFKEDHTNNIVEANAYTLWNINDGWSFSSGMRSNIPIDGQDYYFSAQLSFKFKPSEKQHFLLSGGKYHNYTTPNYFSKSYNLLQSYQLAFDYRFQHRNTLLKAAAYYKNETGKQSTFFTVDKINTFGIELFIEQDFFDYFRMTAANSFIEQPQRIDNRSYPGLSDFDYLLKASLQYNNPRIFTLSLVYISRPGKYYNTINGGRFNPDVGCYKPDFSDNLYSKRYSGYNRFDLSVSKYLPLKKHTFVFFASVNNVFNNKNQEQVQYNKSYTKAHFDYYMLRSIYFGFVWLLPY